MKISTKGRYALRLMLDLALHQDGGPVSLRDVSQRQDISEKYLEQLVSPMTRSGLLRSVRGAAGGYLLTRDPKDYTAGEIIRAQEGSLAPVECAAGPGCCHREDQCATVGLYRRIKDAIDAVVDATTLQDLVDEHKRKTKEL